MKNTVQQTSIIRPAEDTPKSRLWLSNLDQLFARTGYFSFVLSYKHDRSPDFFDVRVVKASLSKVLVPFYPVAGRLAQQKHDDDDMNESGRFEIDCNGDGVLFVEAESDVSMPNLAVELHAYPLMQQIVPVADFSEGISSFPLLLIQLTRFRCGGVAMGIRYHHVLCDGEGFSNFISTWTHFARGGGGTLQAPFIDRTILRSRSPPTTTHQHPEYEPIKKGDQPHLPIPQQHSTSVEILTLSNSKIKNLKNKINLISCESNYTFYEVLAAHLWRCATIARRFEDQNQKTTLHISVNGRQRLDPPLPAGYFGNCVFHAMVVASAAELQSESLEGTVGRIRRSIEKVDDQFMRSAIDYLELSGDGASWFRVPGHSGSPHFKVVSLSRMSFWQDFGWGKPISVGLVSAGEGKCHILPLKDTTGAADDDDDLLISVRLCEEAMVNFKQLLITLQATPRPRFVSPL